jgi:hypothetical protein
MTPSTFRNEWAARGLSRRSGCCAWTGFRVIWRCTTCRAERCSPWTKRIVPRMWGHYRAEADQIFPGQARLGANGVPTRLALWRFSGVAETSLQTIVDGVRASFSDMEGVLQLRVFQAKAAQAGDVIATIELAGPVVVCAPRPDAFGETLRHLNLANVYMPYWR